MAKRLGAIALAIAVLPLATNGAASSTSQPRSIAFATNRAPNLLRAAMFSIRPTGKGRRMVGRGVAGEDEPELSPDGRRILFVRGGVGDLYVAHLDGSHIQRLSPKGVVTNQLEAAISPNGRYVAYSGGRDCDEACLDLEVYVVPLNGGRSRSLGRGTQPAWSPDSRHVAFVDGQDSSVYVARARGRPRPRRIAQGDGPVWAPRAGLIAYRPSPDSGLCVIRSDGSHRRCFSGFYPADLAWSLDGRRVAFSAHGIGYVDLDRGSHLQLTGGFTSEPTWSPDGRSLAYLGVEDTPQGRPDEQVDIVRIRDGQVKRVTAEVAGTNLSALRWTPHRILYATFRRRNDEELAVMRADGSGLRLLTHNAVDDVEPSWSPDRRRIAYSRQRRDPDGVNRGALRVVDAAGAHDMPLTEGSTGLDASPSWSHDGRSIAFVRSDPTAGWMGQLAVLTLATGDVRVLVTDPPLLPGHVSWSSDDSEIVFAAYPPVEIRADLFVVTASGGTSRRLGTGCYSVSSPSWAANGRIAFTGACPDAPDSGVFTVRPDGTGRRFVASNSDVTRGASWSPNGDRLVFSRTRSDVCCDLGDIVVAKDDGTSSRRLTRNFSENKDPVWAP